MKFLFIYVDSVQHKEIEATPSELKIRFTSSPTQQPNDEDTWSQLHTAADAEKKRKGREEKGNRREGKGRKGRIGKGKRKEKEGNGKEGEAREEK